MKKRKPNFPQEIFNVEKTLERVRTMSDADRRKAVEQYKTMFGDSILPPVVLHGELIPSAPYTAKLS